MPPKRPREEEGGAQASCALSCIYRRHQRPGKTLLGHPASLGHSLLALQEVVKAPRKQMYRMRAHSNPLNDATFPVPLSPAHHEW